VLHGLRFPSNGYELRVTKGGETITSSCFRYKIREDPLGFFDKPISMKMESYAAGAKFDSLLFGKDLTDRYIFFPFSRFISKKRRTKAGRPLFPFVHLELLSRHG
jgi:hypothetical protein